MDKRYVVSYAGKRKAFQTFDESREYAESVCKWWATLRQRLEIHITDSETDKVIHKARNW